MKRHATRLTILMLLACLGLLLVGCKSGKTTKRGQATLKTTVTYRERIVLPRKAIITVTFEDVSKMDVAATVIAAKTTLPEGTPPYAIDLMYDASKLSENARYAVRARIEENGKLLFTNDTHIDPFAGPAGEPVEIMVKSVAR